MAKRVLMVIAPEAFRDEEYQQPREEFRKAGFEVVTASTMEGEALGMLGGTAIAEKTIDNVDAGSFDAVVFVGGSGASIYFENAMAHQLARKAAGQRKVVAAICISPTILANAGVLKGKKATVFREKRLIEILKTKGATYTGADVEKDGNVITGSGPHAARRFGQAIVEALS
jgi:protease I